ncbi:hypothetical protein PGT21_050332 [Puccinia graminis f. sp. tritici]|uniref:CCHC-type domain-containing protein n=1 Tax=Puccinia graminis f. sp. tritici TaxID=56615 RepID=A0A5B0MQQ2_PUCGR|nr:hypothetical protein PGT21_050332 [Puccinia graminis f. sp. tritici]
MNNDRQPPVRQNAPPEVPEVNDVADPPQAPAAAEGQQRQQNRDPAERERARQRRNREAPPHQAPPEPRPEDPERNRQIAAVIGAVSNQIHDEDRLQPDGSNFAIWQDFLDERIRDAINVPLFFHFPNNNVTHERIGRSILLTSVDRSLRRGLARHATVHRMWQDIRIRFHSVSRAAQMDLFRRLMSFSISDHPTTAGILTHIGDILDEMETIRMPFTRDHLAGLVLQNGLSSEPELQQEFDRRIELDLQSATAEDPPMNFDEMVRLIDIIRRQLRLQSVNRSSTNTQTPLVMQAEVNPNQAAPAAAHFPGPALHPDNTPDAHDFMAMQAGLCWQCRSPDHMLRNCPMRARTSGPGRQARNSANQARIPQGPTSYAPSGFQSFYPIVTPPGFNGVYPQPQPSHRQQTSPPSNPAHTSQARPADYYRPPQYRLQRVTPPSESIGSQRQKPAAHEASADNDSNNESTARMVELGDVAEDLANINFGHVQADLLDDVPIVDSVATSGNPAFITGEGDLTFSGLDNQNVTIHGVLY